MFGPFQSQAESGEDQYKQMRHLDASVEFVDVCHEAVQEQNQDILKISAFHREWKAAGDRMSRREANLS